MARRILIEFHPMQTRIVILEDDQPVLYMTEEENSRSIVGNIYKGKVQNVLPGMEAAFINIGLEKNAFFHTNDTPQKKKLQPGQEIMVQVTKESVGEKGARVSTDISMPGRNLVFFPDAESSGVSKKITNEVERDRLQGILAELPTGIILRTAAEGVSREELLAEYDTLSAEWVLVQQKFKTKPAPALLYQEEHVFQWLIREHINDQTEVFINQCPAVDDLRQLLKEYTPHAIDKLSVLPTPLIFEYFQLEAKLDKLLQRKVWLKNGSYLVIDRTEALTVFDVNSGKFVGDSSLEQTSLETNLQAAHEVARQLRLRNIGGIIIVDFIDMQLPQNKQAVMNELEAQFRADKVRTTLVGMTTLGLVEITRKKSYREIGTYLQPCRECGGSGRTQSLNDALMSVRRELVRVLVNTNMPIAHIQAGKQLAEALCSTDWLTFDRENGLREMNIYVQSDRRMSANAYRMRLIQPSEVTELSANCVKIQPAAPEIHCILPEKEV